jgi:hypothetical protein
MKQKTYLFITIVLWLVSLTGCNLPQINTGAGDVYGKKTQAWFDFPVDGMILALKPYELVSHVTDPGGIAQVEWSVNGSVVATDPIGKAVETVNELSEFHYRWTPEQPGEYLISVRPQSTGGEWGPSAKVRVTIPGEMTATPTMTATITPSLMPTITATVTPTITPTADDKLALVDMTKSTNQFYHPGCTPDSVTFTIRATKPQDVKYMYLFYKLMDTKGTGQTEINGGRPMKKTGTDTWTLTVKASEIEGYKRFANAWFVYQFIAQGGSEVVARSQAMGDIQLSVCGSAPAEPPGVTLTPGLPVINPSE